MRGFRAKDEDRDRFVELIEAAYVDGQIGDQDRELRVSRALSAATLDELETLTRDLQRPPGHDVVRPSPALPAARPRPLAWVLVALVAVVGLLVAVASLVMFAGSEQDSATSTPTSAVESSASASPVNELDGFEMTTADVRRFVTSYERKFGTLEAFEVAFFPDRIQAQVPVRGSRPRMERWAWDGQWRQDTQAAAVAGPHQRVDLGTVDVRRLFDNIATARRVLGVEKGRFTHALLIRWGAEPTELNIYIGNTFNESGYLSSTPSGEITRRHPYAP